MKKLISMVSDNPYLYLFRSLRSTEILENHFVEIVSNVNMPSISQVVAIWTDDDLCSRPVKRDILVYNHSGATRYSRI
ncbi:hypothetical protein Sjap_004565 [Stephania japonica]|uniref:Uncharacterized protein n=1 Tax=Stephania japonica TaxID=461633 RepID=A0AAP0K4N5_9MAGN